MTEQEKKELSDFVKNNFDRDKKYARIAILGSIFNKSSSIDFALLDNLFSTLRDRSNCEILFIEEEFKDSTLDPQLSEILQKYKITHVFSNCENQVLLSESPEIYTNNSLLNCDLVITIASKRLHTHHSITYNFTDLEELGLLYAPSKFDRRKLKRKEAISIMREGLGGQGKELLNLLSKIHFYGITDGRETICTNEHIPFFKKKMHDKISLQSLSFLTDNINN